jgi:hypothetical protein
MDCSLKNKPYINFKVDSVYNRMLRSLMDCLTFMANPNFLGRAVQTDQAPWDKVNRPGRTPWERERDTEDAAIKQSQKGIPDYQQQKYQQSTEDAWAAMLEKEQSALDVWANNNNRDSETSEQQAASGSEQREAEVESRGRVNTQQVEKVRRKLIPYSIIPQEDGTVRKHRLFPDLSKKQVAKLDNNQRESKATVATKQPQFVEVKRSWPEPRQKNERRMTAANYGAVEIHGFFGLIDDGSDGVGRMLVVHVPKWVKGFFLDIKQGDTIHVYHARGLKIGAALTVLSTGRHKYYSPGRKVTTCTICVPEEQWAPFASYV